MIRTMPYSPKKIKRPWVVESKPFINSDTKFYQSTPWRKFSKIYKDKHPLCVMCESQGEVRIADVTDHIIRLKDGGLPYDEANLQSLCHSHHNQKSINERFKKK